MGYGAACKYLKVRYVTILHIISIITMLYQQIGEPLRVRYYEYLVQLRLSHVRIDEQNPAACLRKRNSQIDDGSGLALYRTGACHNDGFHGLVNARILYVCPEYPVCFRYGGFGITMCNYDISIEHIQALLPFLLNTGMVPMTTKPVCFSTSSGVLTVSSRNSMRNTSPKPAIRPSKTPTA